MEGTFHCETMAESDFLSHKITVRVSLKSIPLDPGQAVLVFPGQFHWFSAFSAKRISWLFITPILTISRLPRG
jgi:D-lyxose ketol-isomerase